MERETIIVRYIKKSIIDAFVKAVAIDTLPISFCDGKKGLKILAKSLTEKGQSYSPSATIYIEHILPFAKTVKKGFLNAADLNTEVVQQLPTFFLSGGAISCDGVKRYITRKMFYNFVLHFLDFKSKPISRGGYFD